MTPKPDKRQSTLRRDANDMFRDPEGRFAVSKVIAAWGQILCGWLLIHHASAIIEHEYALAILLTFLVLPEFAKKYLTMKYGTTK